MEIVPRVSRSFDDKYDISFSLSLSPRGYYVLIYSKDVMECYDVVGKRKMWSMNRKMIWMDDFSWERVRGEECILFQHALERYDVYVARTGELFVSLEIEWGSLCMFLEKWDVWVVEVTEPRLSVLYVYDQRGTFLRKVTKPFPGEWYLTRLTDDSDEQICVFLRAGGVYIKLDISGCEACVVPTEKLSMVCEIYRHSPVIESDETRNHIIFEITNEKLVVFNIKTHISLTIHLPASSRHLTVQMKIVENELITDDKDSKFLIWNLDGDQDEKKKMTHDFSVRREPLLRNDLIMEAGAKRITGHNIETGEIMVFDLLSFEQLNTLIHLHDENKVSYPFAVSWLLRDLIFSFTKNALVQLQIKNT